MADPQNKTFVIVGSDGTRHRFPVGIEPERAAAIVRANETGGTTMGAQNEAPPPVYDPRWLATEGVNAGKNLLRAVAANPEKTIETVGPAAGAAGGFAIGGPVGALAGAGAGYLYGKANRAASNYAQGKPVTEGMPQSVGDLGWDIAENVGGNAVPEAVLGKVGGFLTARGRGLVGRAVAPKLSDINHMSEMGGRAATPQAVRGQIADTLLRETPKDTWSPVSDRALESLVGTARQVHSGNEAAVRAAAEGGATANMAPIVGKATGDALHKAQKFGATPHAEKQAIRARAKDYMTDPESSLTVPFENVKSGDTVGAMGEPISGAPTIERSRIPNMEADPADMLDKYRGLSAKLRGTFGLDQSQQAAQTLDKGVYRGIGEALKDMTPGLREGMQREHEIINALDALVSRSYQQSTAKPVNLYTLLGILSSNPEAIALGVGNYPVVMAGVGRSLYNAGTRMTANAPDTANIYRAALLGLMSQRTPEK
jgi:hypothetical protein